VDQDHSKTIDRQEYARLFQILYLAVWGQEQYDNVGEQNILKLANEDFLKDCMGRQEEVLNKATFMQCFFQLTDMWTDDILEENYVEFLEKLHNEMRLRTKFEKAQSKLVGLHSCPNKRCMSAGEAQEYILSSEARRMMMMSEMSCVDREAFVSSLAKVTAGMGKQQIQEYMQHLAKATAGMSKQQIQAYIGRVVAAAEESGHDRHRSSKPTISKRNRTASKRLPSLVLNAPATATATTTVTGDFTTVRGVVLSNLCAEQLVAKYAGLMKKAVQDRKRVFHRGADISFQVFAAAAREARLKKGVGVEAPPKLFFIEARRRRSSSSSSMRQRICFS
jgi:hypothetical protein